MMIKSKTNEELWNYQSSFLDKRCAVIETPGGLMELYRYNISAVFSYLAKTVLPIRDDESAEREGEYLDRRIMDDLLRDRDMYYYGYRVRKTDDPYPRILSEGDPELMDYVLVKRLDDIPILCKADFRGRDVYAVLTDVLGVRPSLICVDMTGTAYWGLVNKNPDGDVHWELGQGYYVHGDIAMTGEPYGDNIPLVEPFDFSKYRQQDKPQTPIPDHARTPHVTLHWQEREGGAIRRYPGDLLGATKPVHHEHGDWWLD